MGQPPEKRLCYGCGCRRTRSDYRAKQWANKGSRGRYCAGCEANRESAADAARLAPGLDNCDAHLCILDDGQLEQPFAGGRFRCVASSTYRDGHQLAGKRAVAKWFKAGAAFDSTFFDKHLQAVAKAVELVEAFNGEQIANGLIRVNTPEVWEFSRNCGRRYAGKKHLVERYIHNYQRFNSNSGWATTAARWGGIMQALSHYTYHASGGRLVLVDLQGGVFPGGAILTDPVILSEERSYGVTDLGAAGIASWFVTHACTDFCRRSWLTPPNPARHYPVRRETTMEEPPLAGSRAGGPPQRGRPVKQEPGADGRARPATRRWGTRQIDGTRRG